MYFLVIGAQRCGTTYLRGLLAGHPDVAMAEPARPEPKVFLDDLVLGLGREWYDETYFTHARPGQVRGEKSTSYLEHPEAGARAEAVLGEHLAIAQLRDPIERAVSNWAFSTENGLEQRPLERALLDELSGHRPPEPAGTSVSPYAYLERGLYAQALRPWLSRYGARLRVQFLGDPIEETYAFLGLDPAVRPVGLGDPVNRSTLVVPPLESKLYARLREHFAESDEDLADAIGRRPPWQ